MGLINRASQAVNEEKEKRAQFEYQGFRWNQYVATAYYKDLISYFD